MPKRLASLALVLLLSACGSDNPSRFAGEPLTPDGVGMAPPVAEQRSYAVVAPHGASRLDEYYWLRDDAREDPRMLAYLGAENTYTDTVMAPLAQAQSRLYDELVGRLKQDDATVPALEKGYWYYTRYEEGKEYPVHARRQGSMDAPEQVLLDLNALAAGKSFFSIPGWAVSPDNSRVAYLEDSVGRNQFVLRVRNLSTGAIVSPGVNGLSNQLVWGGDSQTLYVIENDPVTLLNKRVLRVNLNTGATQSLYSEADDSYYIGLGLTRSESYICIYLESTLSHEQRCMDRNAPGEFKLIAARERDFIYTADHLGNRWVVRTNWNAQNFKLMQFADGVWNKRSEWVDLLAHDAATLVKSFILFDGFMAIDERSGGLTRIRVLRNDGRSSFAAADESAYEILTSTNRQSSSDWLRYTYTSLTTPTTTYELNITTNERRLLKEAPVLGGFDKANYVTERIWASARDGTQVPVSLVYRKGFQRDGSAALLQYGYGSYGYSMEPWFSSNIISLLDRGMVYAIAHVRGGEEMGRSWYEEGKLLKKMNTFTDFIDVTTHLVAQRYAAPDRVAAMGGSAGGLLMGAVANLAPEKYRVIISQVPFVDIVTTMLDASIPLTTNEYDEWGNPEDPTYYQYMLSYSPYDQLRATRYPAMFVGTGLWDSQVQYWEPAKYVARLRARSTPDKLLVLRTKMEAGHGGASGRFQRYHDIAEYYAFMLNQLRVPE